MRALTIWQPWASLIALGVKKYETRHWSARYRGNLAIHAAKRWTGAEQRMTASLCQEWMTVRAALDCMSGEPPALPLGAGRRLDTQTEAHVYWALGMPWLPPHLRSAVTYQRVAARARHPYIRQLRDASQAWWTGAVEMERYDSLYWPHDDGSVQVTTSPYWLATGTNIEMRQEAML